MLSIVVVEGLGGAASRTHSQCPDPHFSQPVLSLSLTYFATTGRGGSGRGASGGGLGLGGPPRGPNRGMSGGLLRRQSSASTKSVPQFGGKYAAIMARKHEAVSSSDEDDDARNTCDDIAFVPPEVQVRRLYIYIYNRFADGRCHSFSSF